jgi:hypothetical protein
MLGEFSTTPSDAPFPPLTCPGRAPLNSRWIEDPQRRRRRLPRRPRSLRGSESGTWRPSRRATRSSSAVAQEMLGCRRGGFGRRSGRTRFEMSPARVLVVKGCWRVAFSGVGLSRCYSWPCSVTWCICCGTPSRHLIPGKQLSIYPMVLLTPQCFTLLQLAKVVWLCSLSS